MPQHTKHVQCAVCDGWGDLKRPLSTFRWVVRLFGERRTCYRCDGYGCVIERTRTQWVDPDLAEPPSPPRGGGGEATAR